MKKIVSGFFLGLQLLTQPVGGSPSTFPNAYNQPIFVNLQESIGSDYFVSPQNLGPTIINQERNKGSGGGFDIGHWKNNQDLLALANGSQTKVNTFVQTMESGLETLKDNTRFKSILKNYFSNDINQLMARLATVALLETNLDNTLSGALGEKGYFQILTKECTIKTNLKGSQKTAQNPDPIIERIKKERGLSWLKNADYLGIIMIMEDAADVTYALSNPTTKDKYYQYLASDFNYVGAALLYHNKGVMLYEIIEELKKEGNNQITLEDILERMAKKSGGTVLFGESRFTGLETFYIPLKANGKWLLTGNSLRCAVGFDYVNVGSALYRIFLGL